MARFNLLTTSLFAAAAFSSLASAANILSSSGFTNCASNATIKVNNANIQFDQSTGIVTFDASGTSTEEQKVMASLVVTAYGQQVYSKSFNPCDSATMVEQLCPVPKGTFSASGNQTIPSSYLSQIPSIAFSIPDIDADAELLLTAIDGGQDVGCVQTAVTNGKSLDTPAVQGIGAGILAGSLILAGVGAFANAGAAGATSPSPSFGAMVGWFQGMAMNGMLSVNYPGAYRSFAKNFGFGGGLVPWTGLQDSIDSFRAATGGNLTDNSMPYLLNTTLTYDDGSSNDTDTSLARRGFYIRDITTSTGSTANSSETGIQAKVHGIEAYVEQLSIPDANTFMTVLVVTAIVIAAIVVAILGFKLILELWATFASFPKRLSNFRKRYWRTTANTITNLILLLYGIWTIWCVFQFTNGDSWAAKTLAAVTWALFTATLLFYTTMVFLAHKKAKQAGLGADELYENKETWHKYSLLYDSYKRGYWWLFVPFIIYMFAKGVTIAAGNGKGLTQTVAQLIIESLMCILLLWTRPFATKGSNWINISIQVVRVISIICILIFCEELGFQQTTQTITGVVLIAVQCTLTGILGILLLVNALRLMFRENIHVKQRKEAEKKRKELEAGLPYSDDKDDTPEDIPMVNRRNTAYGNGAAEPKTPLMRDSSPVDPSRMHRPTYSRDNSATALTSAAAPFGRVPSHGSGMGGADDGMADWPLNRPMSRQPALPSVDPGVATVGNGRPAHRMTRQPTLPNF